MMTPPPSRWKVVERGRRLEVIDLRAGADERRLAKPPAARGSAPVTKTSLTGLRKISFDGSSELTTHRLYDDHGPRTVRLDPASARIAGIAAAATVLAATALIVTAIFWPAILLILPVLAQDKPRAAIRRPVTAWLDDRARQAG
ncbi:hypothetical protein [Sphingomonas beigongshangi]|jgi:hypothetical protein|uniref:hypothetical protein n=1 Tax=Sphingomonas beigongshangi TaxID=2782540 RepID=UPI001AEE86A6|nr:hypothetical protein [Sphingomonas beigongshangi]